jgi:hypothetical protein
VKSQLRRTACADDLDIAPQHALRMTGPERFHGRFLCCKSAGQMRGRIPATLCVRNFSGREDAIQEAIAVSREYLFDPIDFGCVEPNADDVHTCRAVSL